MAGEFFGDCSSTGLSLSCAVPAAVSTQLSNPSTITFNTREENCVEFMAPLRGQLKDARRAENSAALGGMRNPTRSVDKLPQARRVGRRLRTIMQDYLDNNPSCKQQCGRALEPSTSSSTRAAGPSDDHVNTIRTLLCSDLGWDAKAHDIKALEDVCTELYFPLWLRGSPPLATQMCTCPDGFGKELPRALMHNLKTSASSR